MASSEGMAPTGSDTAGLEEEAEWQVVVTTLREQLESSSSAADAAQIIELLRSLRGHMPCDELVAQVREWVERRLHELVAKFHLASHEDNDLLAMDGAVRSARELITRAQPELGDLSLFVEILDALEPQLRSKLEAVIKKANRHELRLLYADFLLRPAKSSTDETQSCLPGGSSSRIAGDAAASWSGLRALCLQKYREQVEKHVHSECVVAMTKLHKVLEARESTVGHVQSSADHARTPAPRVPSLEAVEKEEAVGFPAVDVLRAYLEGIAQVADELQDGAQLPTGFVASAHADLEQEACIQLVELLGGVLCLEEALLAAASALRRAPRRNLSSETVSLADRMLDRVLDGNLRSRSPSLRGKHGEGEHVNGVGAALGCSPAGESVGTAAVERDACLLALELRLEEVAQVLEVITLFVGFCDHNLERPEIVRQPPLPTACDSPVGSMAPGVRAALASDVAGEVSGCGQQALLPATTMETSFQSFSTGTVCASATAPPTCTTTAPPGVAQTSAASFTCEISDVIDGANTRCLADTDLAAAAMSTREAADVVVADADVMLTCAECVVTSDESAAPREISSLEVTPSDAQGAPLDTEARVEVPLVEVDHPDACDMSTVAGCDASLTDVGATTCSASPMGAHPSGSALVDVITFAAGDIARHMCEGRRLLDKYSSSLARALVEGESSYLARAIGVACESSELEADALTLALVDGAFFALLRAFQRAKRTGMLSLTMLPLLDRLADSIRDGPLQALKWHARNAGAAAADNFSFLAAANSAECAAAYSRRLRSLIAEALGVHDTELTAIAAPSLGRLEALAATFDDTAKRAMSELAATLMPTSWLLFEYEPADYQLVSAGEATEAALRAQFESGVLVPLSRTLASLRESLSQSNLEWLVHALGVGLSARLESGAMAKSFDELGAMFFSEQIRRLSDTLASVSAATVRNDLGRVTQIAFLLNAGSVGEAAGLLLSQLATGAVSGGGGGGSSNRLTPTEAGRVLTLRVEFDRVEVGELLGVYIEEDEEVQQERRTAACDHSAQTTMVTDPQTISPMEGTSLTTSAGGGSDVGGAEAGSARVAAAAKQATALAGAVASVGASRALTMGRGLFNAGRELLREAALEND